MKHDGPEARHLPALPLLRVGCAGWTIPARHAALFPAQGTHLQRYASRFNCVEINSSFYRPHQATTYRRWADSVPPGFSFSVKMPREISHDARLRACGRELDAFLASVMALGDALGCLLLQLPPSFEYEAAVAGRFLKRLRERYDGELVCEPRHRTWFTRRAARNLCKHRVALSAADPSRCARAALPGAYPSLQYARLHGSPRMYYDAYDAATLARVARRALRPSASTRERWLVFDNTALGHATSDALTTMRLLHAETSSTPALARDTLLSRPPA